MKDNTFDDQWRVVYINGEKRRATKSWFPHLVSDFDGKFFVDSPEFPFTRCSQHDLRRGATEHLEKGGRVKSSGSWYSLKPEEKLK